MKIVFSDEELKGMKHRVKKGCLYEKNDFYGDYDVECNSCPIPFLMGNDTFGCTEFQKEVVEAVKGNILFVENGNIIKNKLRSEKMEITLTTQDADKVLKILRKQYQEVMTKKNDHEEMLQKYQSKDDQRMTDIMKLFKDNAKEKGISVDFEKDFIDTVKREIAEYDAKLSEIEYAILVMTAGSSKDI